MTRQDRAELQVAAVIGAVLDPGVSSPTILFGERSLVIIGQESGNKHLVPSLAVREGHHKPVVRHASSKKA